MESTHHRAPEEMVTERALQDERLAGESVTAEARGGIVRLVGLVDSDEQRELAVQIARRVPGVRHVEDLLAVG